MSLGLRNGWPVLGSCQAWVQGLKPEPIGTWALGLDIRGAWAHGPRTLGLHIRGALGHYYGGAWGSWAPMGTLYGRVFFLLSLCGPIIVLSNPGALEPRLSVSGTA